MRGGCLTRKEHFRGRAENRHHDEHLGGRSASAGSTSGSSDLQACVVRSPNDDKWQARGITSDSGAHGDASIAGGRVPRTGEAGGVLGGSGGIGDGPGGGSGGGPPVANHNLMFSQELPLSLCQQC